MDKPTGPAAQLCVSWPVRHTRRAPTAVVYQDEHGPMIRTSPFGQSDGVHLSITIERWRQWNAIVEQAIAESVALRLAGAAL